MSARPVNAKDGKKVTIIHNYGHSSHGKFYEISRDRRSSKYVGYQSSWGASQRVLKLLEDANLVARL